VNALRAARPNLSNQDLANERPEDHQTKGHWAGTATPDARARKTQSGGQRRAA